MTRNGECLFLQLDRFAKTPDILRIGGAKIKKGGEVAQARFTLTMIPVTGSEGLPGQRDFFIAGGFSVTI
jgi:hypothetical protein